MAPKTHKEDPRGALWPIMGRRWLPANSKDAQNGSNERPTWPKLYTGWLQTAPKKTQDGPKRATKMPGDAKRAFPKAQPWPAINIEKLKEN